MTVFYKRFIHRRVYEKELGTAEKQKDVRHFKLAASSKNLIRSFSQIIRVRD